MTRESGRAATAGAAVRVRVHFCAAVLGLLAGLGCSSTGASEPHEDAAASGGHPGTGTGGSISTGGNDGSGGQAGGGGAGSRGGGGHAGGGASGGRGGSVGGHPGGGASGASGGGGTTDGGASGGASGEFAAVKTILATWCVRCHDPAHPFVPETTTFVAMDLTAAGAYAALVNKAAAETCGGIRVVPGDPTKSYLFHKVSDASPCDGSRMPARGMIAIQQQLSSTDIETIRAWIAHGAKP